MKRLKFSYLLCIILLIFVLAGCGQGPEVSPGEARDLPEDGLLIHFIDVGQGDSILKWIRRPSSGRSRAF